MRPANPETTRRQDVLVVAFSVWTIVGLFLDGYAHENFRELESFVTPWHGVFYTGFTATALTMVWIIGRRREEGQPWSRAIPPGYRLGLIGLGLFALGGVGDAVWHTVFGIEATIDALLSPTHIVLFVGLLLVLTIPLRKPSNFAVARPAWSDVGVAVVALVLSVSLVAFFFVYLWGPGVTWVFRIPFDPVTEEGGMAVMAGVGAALVATAILVMPILWVVRRILPPMGAITALLVVPNALIVLAFDRDRTAVVAALLAGLAADLLLRRVAQPEHRTLAFGAGIPLVLWTAVFALQATGQGLAWQAELWGGVIVFSTLEGIALALLSAPPAITAGHAPPSVPTPVELNSLR